MENQKLGFLGRIGRSQVVVIAKSIDDAKNKIEFNSNGKPWELKVDGALRVIE